MAVAAALMTVEEFRNLPAIEGYRTELRHGEVVQVPSPRRKHHVRTYCIREVLRPVAQPLGYLDKEVPYRALPQHELRYADLAFVRWDLWEAADPDDALEGAPDLVIEVLSPSNSAEALLETKQLCLANGCREFWVVYPKLMQIEVSTASGTRMFGLGESIPSVVFPGHSFAVADLMSDLRR